MTDRPPPNRGQGPTVYTCCREKFIGWPTYVEHRERKHSGDPKPTDAACRFCEVRLPVGELWKHELWHDGREVSQ